MRKAFLLLVGTVGLLQVTIAQTATGVIRGIIHTSDGQPATAVTVHLKGSNKTALTAESGDFIFRSVHPGSDTLEVSLVGYQTLLQPVEVTSGQTARVTLQLVLSNQQLEDVIISGGENKFVRHSSDDLAKMPLANLENAQVYSTVTKDLMTEQSAFTLEQAVANVPGITELWAPTNRAGDGGAYFTSRGFSVSAQLRNGVAGNITESIDAANIERVEVLKGPSATLFGSTLTSFGGLINVVTKKPYDVLGGEFSYTGGTDAYNRFSADFNSPLDSAHRTLFRLNTSYTSQGSFQDAGFSHRFMAAPSLTYKVNDRLSFTVEAEIYKSLATTPQIIYFGATVPQLGVSSADKLSLGYTRSYMSNDITINSGNANFFGQMDYIVSKDWKSQTNVSVTNSSSNGYQPYFYLMPGDSTLQRDAWKSVGQDNAIDLQENFIGRFRVGGMRNRLVAGLDFYTYHPNISYQQFMGPGGVEDMFDVVRTQGVSPNYQNFNKVKLDSIYNASPYTAPYNEIYTSNTYSAYVSDVLNITDNLIASAALRVDHFDNKGNYDPTSGTTSGGFQQTVFSPKFGLVYQVVPGKVSLFGNYQNGFTNENGVDYNDKPFKPEQANQWEGGVKLEGWAGKISGTVSYYNIDVTNVIRSYPANPILSIQDGTQLSKGIEAELIAGPFSGFNVVAGYAYNDSKYTQSDADVQGRRPTTAGAPTTANLWVSYRLTKGKAKGWGIGAGGNYNSANEVQNAVSTGVFTLPAFTVVNASLFYDAPKYRFALKVNNLANQKYWIGYTTVDPQPLRTILATVAFKF